MVWKCGGEETGGERNTLSMLYLRFKSQESRVKSLDTFNTGTRVHLGREGRQGVGFTWKVYCFLPLPTPSHTYLRCSVVDRSRPSSRESTFNLVFSHQRTVLLRLILIHWIVLFCMCSLVNQEIFDMAAALGIKADDEFYLLSIAQHAGMSPCVRVAVCVCHHRCMSLHVHVIVCECMCILYWSVYMRTCSCVHAWICVCGNIHACTHLVIHI